MDDHAKMEAISEMVHDYWHEKESKNKRRYSQNEIAADFGVNPTSLSYWLRKLRLPDEENKQRLADKIGYIEFYERLGEQPRIPKSGKIRHLLDLIANDHDIDEFINWLERRRKGKLGGEEAASES